MTSIELLYAAIIFALLLYGLHRFLLVIESCCTRSRHGGNASEPRPCVVGARFPRVLVQLPTYNEDPDHVLRLIDSVLALDWPEDRLEIQLLDDSTDGSSEVLTARLAARGAQRVPVDHIRRSNRVGFKAGALQQGLRQSNAEFVAIFDADFVVPADFLRRAMPEFDSDRIAMVQARWGFLNEDRNLLTRVQAVMLSGHFSIEHGARARAGRFFNFNGTAGVWRCAAIVDAGGWSGDSITEDVDLSLRAWLRGWRFRYLDSLEVASELPETIPAYKVQQNRWVSGSIDTARRYLPSIWRSDISLAQKLDVSFYLTANLTFPMLLLVLLILPATLFARWQQQANVLVHLDVPLLYVATTSLLCYAARVRGARSALPYFLIRVPAMMALGLGMTPHNSLAVFKGILGRARVFERTPKSTRTTPASRAAGGWNFVRVGEGAMALHCACVLTAALATEQLPGLPMMGLVVVGFLYVLLQAPAHRLSLSSEGRPERETIGNLGTE